MFRECKEEFFRKREISLLFHAEQKKAETKINMRGGDGTVRLDAFMNAEQMPRHYRLFSEITIEPGCSIGRHVHEGESEIFYILEGTGVLDDNGAERAVGPGDVCVCYDGEAHAIANRSDGTLRFLGCIVKND